MRKNVFWIALTVCFTGVLFQSTQKLAGTNQASRFKNIQVLTDLSDREIQQTMQKWAKQLGTKCTECHVQGDFASDEREHKRYAREMVKVVNVLNELPFFAEADKKADCFLCHKGAVHIDRAP